MASYTVAIVLCVSLLAPGCAARSYSTSSPRAAAGGAASQGSDIPRSYAEQLPVGRDVELRLKSGERFKGTYMGVEGDAVRVQPSTRIPVPPRVVPLADLAQLRLVSGNGSSVGKAIAIGAAAGAGAFFTLLLIAIGVSAS